MKVTIDERIETARELIDDFSKRTGVTGGEGNPERRYLWTDAFAVKAFFALSHVLDDNLYRQHALRLINMVHHSLGRHRHDDPREGWISGLSESEGEEHPTSGGLRIGKKLRDRQANIALSESTEWERDGQYFHYLTRWFNALLQAYRETNDRKYALWAAELIEAGEKFMVQADGLTRMFWKMNIDLSSPTVTSMGAHDPLEGLICIYSALEVTPEKTHDLENLMYKLHTLCKNMNWHTTDTLGIGGLLLNTARSAELKSSMGELPDSIKPNKLFSESLKGLQSYSNHLHDPLQVAERRLAFRECGLTLGVNTLYAMREHYIEQINDLQKLEKILNVVEDIEQFWIHPGNQKAPSWSEHEDINAITLAASLLASESPSSFSSLS